jgi:hypothetical protein
MYTFLITDLIKVLSLDVSRNPNNETCVPLVHFVI